MKSINASQCAVHVCICTNERVAGDMSSCSQVGGVDLFQRLKKQVLAEALSGTHWITRTGCLGFCNVVGTTVVIYRPDAAPEWLSAVTDDDYPALWKKIRSVG